MNVWATQIGNYSSFFVNSSVLDTDAINIKMLARQLNAVNSLVSLGDLIAMTSGSEWRIGADKTTLTPASVYAKAQGYRGSVGIDPVIVGSKLVYVQANGTVVRNFGYDYSIDSYAGSDLRILSEHLFTNYQLVEMDYQQDNDSLIWCVRDDGKLLCLTYMDEQDVVAWSRHDTDGLVESCCVIPAEGYDELWVVVKRGDNRFLEYMSRRMIPDDTSEDVTFALKDQVFLDSSITYDGQAVNDSNVKLLMHLDGSNNSEEFIDDSPQAHVVTKGTFSPTVLDDQSSTTENKALIHCDGTNGGTTFVDSATSKTITNTEAYDALTMLMLHLNNNVTDSATAKSITNNNVSFSDTIYKFGTHSGSFNGTTSDLRIPASADMEFGTGNFTIDFWIYPVDFDPSSSGASHFLYNSWYVVGKTGNFLMDMADNGYVGFNVYDDQTAKLAISNSTALSLNTWQHVAVVRNGNSFNLYVNGTSVASGTYSGAVGPASGDFRIGKGGYIGGGSYYPWQGYLDSFRISKGVARWSAAFTPYRSSYGTVATITADKKFGTACAEFKGSGEALSLADSADFDFGNGNFTIDCWINPSQKVTNGAIYWQAEAAANREIAFVYSGASDTIAFTAVTVGTTNAAYRWNFTHSINNWYHLALVRSGTSLVLYVNGVAATEYEAPTAISTNTLPNVGAAVYIGSRNYNDDLYFPGLIDELRVSKGVARWTADFDVPVLAYPYTTYTPAITGSPKLSTAQYKFSTASLLLDGTNSFLSVDDSSDWNFGTGNFTIDFWIRFTSLTGAQTIVSQYEDASNYWLLEKDSSHKIHIKFVDGGATKGEYTTNAAAFALADTWYHVVVERSTTTAKVFVGGITKAVTANTAFSTNDVGDIVGVLKIGTYNSTNYLKAYLDEFRISKGIVRWANDFTPNAFPYPWPDTQISTMTGLDHLEGKTVSILADGNVLTPQVVVSGDVALGGDYSVVHAGLPYQSDLETLNIEQALRSGAMQGRAVKVSNVTFRLVNSRGGWVGPNSSKIWNGFPNAIKVAQQETTLDLFTGDIRVPIGAGYEDGGRIFYRQVDPLPVTISAVIPEFTVM
jgi:hypothetical protein